MAAAGCALLKGTPEESAARPPAPKVNIIKDEGVKDLGSDWYEAVGRASYANITPDEARRKAIINACINAIQYCGFEVNQRNLDVQMESNRKIVQNDFLSLTSVTTKGVVLDKLVIDDKVFNDGENVERVVRVRVKVGTQKGQKDPYFSIRASLNREVFKLADTLKVGLTSTQDCYITIFNISDDMVYILFPNMYCGDNLVQKGQKFEFPSKTHEKMGISIPAMLPNDKNMDMGIIKIIATKKPASFEGLCRQSQYGTYEMVLHDLLEFLIGLPRDEIEEVDLTYQITK